MTRKAAIKIFIALILFVIIEFIRLGYIRMDQAQQVKDEERFDIINTQIIELQDRVSELEKQIKIDE